MQSFILSGLPGAISEAREYGFPAMEDLSTRLLATTDHDGWSMPDVFESSSTNDGPGTEGLQIIYRGRTKNSDLARELLDRDFRLASDDNGETFFGCLTLLRHRSNLVSPGEAPFSAAYGEALTAIFLKDAPLSGHQSGEQLLASLTLDPGVAMFLDEL